MPADFLRIPPFPGHRAKAISRDGNATLDAGAVAALVSARVGGTFWGAQPPLDPAEGVLLAPDDKAQLAEMLEALGNRPAVLYGPVGLAAPDLYRCIAYTCDPWWLARHTGEVWAGAGQELALVAGLCGTALRVFGDGPFVASATDAVGLTARTLAQREWGDPFTDEPSDLARTVALLADWRRLIDSNRDVAAVFGVARWKRVTCDPLLWDGSGAVRHARQVPVGLRPDQQVLAWRSRTSPAVLDDLTRRGVAIAEVEDGFIRSSGLGADCVPPLSIIADRSGIYFDASGPSDLESILESTEVSPATRERAAALREAIVRGAVSKYGQGGASTGRARDGRRHVLVTGQVEDDRSILTGGAGMSNLELLERARAIEGDAWIIYKPHPDVEAGHRKGQVAIGDVMRLADEIAQEAPILPLINSVDALHVITSLAGFEALLRGKDVTTHGTPFYAGWGLTRDLAPVPARRSRRRSLDELVAATLLAYPRYVDPLTRLPCGPELLVRRMAAGQAHVASPLIALRRWQGWLNRTMQAVSGGER
ncbi:beta-3-deoxy-D-manno-oct-2-ulosonic acid transferase [Novosphingobium sp.]|uniref:capsular polysaccharide export protein, LipB/KpsS family n=1 Tax=Novosphingobium sp. TaxID=1874826 RepID=UPI0038BB031D